MPSHLHELLLRLFLNRSQSAADLLRELDVQLPDYDEVRVDSSDLSNLQPVEYRADLVLFLTHKSQKMLGVIVEVQLGRDEDKRYSWPAYLANLRARHRCPVCLLVITIEDAVTRWAERPIHVGPGNLCRPWVIGPSNTPTVETLHEAEGKVELAVLSAIAHGRDTDIPLAIRIASVAIVASSGIDVERSKLYVDSILNHLSLKAPEAFMIAMNSLGYPYQSEFARHYVAQGKMELTLRLLTLRFGQLTESAQGRVRAAQDAQLDAVAERILTAATLEEALSQLC